LSILARAWRIHLVSRSLTGARRDERPATFQATEDIGWSVCANGAAIGRINRGDITALLYPQDIKAEELAPA
jgi:hypothetical protein